MHIGVFCSSSTRIDQKYHALAEEAGRLMVRRGHELVYGGGGVGLMGSIARAVHEEDGSVYGVIPEALKEREGIAYDLADELVVTETMKERKSTIYARSDAFMVLPGGLGTLEEFMEVVTLKQLEYHRKPIALLNANGFYDRLLSFFEQLHERQFTHRGSREIFEVVSTPVEALDFIDSYAPSLA